MLFRLMIDVLLDFGSGIWNFVCFFFGHERVESRNTTHPKIKAHTHQLLLTGTVHQPINKEVDWHDMKVFRRYPDLWIILLFNLSWFCWTPTDALSLSTLDSLLDRRTALLESSSSMSLMLNTLLPVADNKSDSTSKLQIVQDPNSYSALAYGGSHHQTPDGAKNKNNRPLILVLHGAGKNDLEILQDLGDPRGEHAGLIPSLIASGQAPSELLDNFAVLAPYSQGKPSFYQDSRSKLLQFVDWAIQNQGTGQCSITFDPKRIILFGFSDGATVAVELLTTSRFAGGVICSYGYNGPALPSRALERLQNKPMWVFHSADDVIFDVKNSDRLVEQLRSVNQGTSNDIVKYSRYDSDPENLPPRVRGHSMGITASKQAAVYEWILKLPPAAY